MPGENSRIKKTKRINEQRTEGILFFPFPSHVSHRVSSVVLSYSFDIYKVLIFGNGFIQILYFKSFAYLFLYVSFVNDPSAGSPTETLLRLLLPLNDQVWSSSR